ncbi:MAG: PQQ-binding-like beta-propeller repeat protein, partial [Acidimicrobiales bacterium]
LYVFGGRTTAGVVDDIWRLDPSVAAPSFSQVGTLNIPMSDMASVDVGGTVYLLGGEGQLGQPSQGVGVLRMIAGTVPNTPGILGPVFDGHLLIADRGNNRLLLVDTQKNVSWTFPDATHPGPAQGFFYPDDAFFAKGGTAIITNEEDQDTIIEISYPSGSLIASYGHPNVPGRATGYLNQPDDAYLLKDGSVVVADALNCRILFLNPDFTYKSEIGTAPTCVHNFPTSVGYPNGDTPLADGNILVSEINGSYVDEVTPAGQVVWSYKMPIAYPSDPQQLGPDLYLVADYSNPGGLYEFTREGQIVWQYHATSAENTLSHPSLAEVLPNGLICVNDDYRDRVVIIDPTDDQVVWQDGRTDQAGT